MGQQRADGQKILVPEFLVPFEALATLAAEEFELELEENINFHEFYEKKYERVREEAQRLGSVEALPGYKRYMLNEFERKVRADELDEASLREQWEISGLYTVFRFRKVGPEGCKQKIRKR